MLLDCDAQGTAQRWARAGRLPHQTEAVPEKVLDETPGDVDEIAERLSADVEVLVLDLPPYLKDTQRGALLVSDLVVLPVGASVADLDPTHRAMELVREARELRGGTAPRCLLVPSKIDRRTAAGREIDAVLHDFGEPVGPAIGQRQPHVDALSAGLWVGEYAPRSAAHQEVSTLAAVVGRLIGVGHAKAAHA